MRLASEGRFAGTVLDAGCGTGENALHVASLGLSVFAVDVAETALAIAREKARNRGIQAEFAIAHAFQLEQDFGFLWFENEYTISATAKWILAANAAEARVK